MYYVYFAAALSRGILYLLLILLVLYQFLPFIQKRSGEFEKCIDRFVRPLVFAGDCFCRMFSLPLNRGGIDFRYPVISLFLWLCVLAVSVR